ncbi:MAG: hypothetical protein HC795_02330 [Coleofasciculaceae cyanobacterium RL_1_1]|nr:hypothetical protein [Coleofasciculaceae cyanobacterium RL_1_1]
MPTTAESVNLSTNVSNPVTLAEPFTDFWFGQVDAPGAIAIGMAEGTRTIDGVRTAAWYGHTDPGNANYNVGTFSSQNTALSPELADDQELQRIREKLSILFESNRTYPLSNIFPLLICRFKRGVHFRPLVNISKLYVSAI